MAQKPQNAEENIVSLEVDDVLISLFLPDQDDHIQKTIIRENNFYERHMLDDIRNRLSGGGIAIDVGAHVGNHTIFLSKVCGMEVIAIEPYRHCFEILKKNVTLNNVADRVTVIQKAVGRTAGLGEVVLSSKKNLGQARIQKRPDGRVEIIPLDSLQISSPVALIKIDVEGMEIDVLEGARGLIERFRPLVYAEAQTAAAFTELRSFFSGFSYDPIDRFNVTPTFIFVPCHTREEQFAALIGSLRRLQEEADRQATEILRLRQLEKHRQQIDKRLGKAEAELRQSLEAQRQEVERHEKAEAELRQSLEAQRQEVERQKQKLQDGDKEVARLQCQRQIAEARVKELETSTSFQLGRAVVEALVHPSPALWALPGRLVRIALDRKKRQQAPQKRQQAPQPEPDENKKISVIMTTYNSADYVSDAIRSILDQTHRNLELIVVDDASLDGTFEMLLDHARADNRVRPFKCLENRGTYWCKNFGITKATGAYLTFQDSDDVSDPDRLDAQLKVLRSDPRAVVATCNYVRIRPNGELILNRGKFERMALMAPMFKKDAVLDTVGYFDSVRTSADDEMCHRLRLVFGTDTIRHVDRPLYVASHREGSLTSASNQVDLSVEEKAGSLSFLSPDRRKYVCAYQKWHKSIKKGDEAPYMAFPLLRRRFPAPDGLLIDSKPAEEYVTASVASFAAREDSLKQAVASILPQIDRLNVYLNDYDAIPEFLRHPKITVARGQEHGDLRDNGKFFFLRSVAAGYHFTIDDDIIYPLNYVQHLILKILQYRKQTMVGIHGVTFADPIERFYNERKVSVFWEGLDVDQVVNLLGSGTVAYHTSTVELDFKDFKVPGMGDLWLAVAAKRQKVPMIAVARARNWLMPIQNNDPGLYEEFLERDGIQTDVARLEAPWGLQSLARNYSSLADHFISNFSTEALRSNQIDVDFWQSFAHYSRTT